MGTIDKMSSNNVEKNYKTVMTLSQKVIVLYVKESLKVMLYYFKRKSQYTTKCIKNRS